MSAVPNRRRRPVIAGLVALIAMGTMVSPAAGAIHTADAVVVTTSVAAVKYDEVGGRVDCPAGWVVISGGASWLVGSLPQTTDQAKNRTLDASRPVAGGTAWYAVGANRDVDATFRVVAWCLPAAQVGTPVIRRRTLGASARPSGSVDCPAGHRAVTGGASLQAAGEPLTPQVAEHGALAGLQMRANGRGWQASALRDSGSAARLRLIVLCRPDAAVGAYSRAAETATTGQTRARVAFCTGGGGIMGGGASWQTTGGALLGNIGLLSSSSPDVTHGGEWFASGRLRLTSATVRFKVTAVCRPA